MKKFIFSLVFFLSFTFLFFFLFSSFTYSQFVFRQRTFNGTGSQLDCIKKIVTDKFSNAYVTGFSWGTNSKNDYLTVKYSSNGDVLWSARYNGPGNDLDSANCLVTDISGNVYVTGTSRSGNYYGAEDYCTIKYNTSGVQQWVARYNGAGASDCTDPDYAKIIKIDAAGNIYVTGDAYNTSKLFNIVTIKYNNNGVQQWVASYNNNSSNKDDRVNDMFIDNLGNIYLTGLSFQNNQNNDYITLKYNSSGSLLWSARYNGPASGNDVANSITVDKLGTVFVTGQSLGITTDMDIATIAYSNDGVQQWVQRYNSRTNTFEEGKLISMAFPDWVVVAGNSNKGTADDFDYLVALYSNSGELKWVRQFDGVNSGTDKVTDMKIAKKSCFGIFDEPCYIDYIYVTGESVGDNTLSDFLTQKLDVSGNLLWQIRYNYFSTSKDVPYSLTVRDYADTVYVAGLSNNDFSTIWIRDDRVIGPGKEETDNLNEKFFLTNYPNPFNPSTDIIFNLLKSGNVSVKIYDIIGREVQILVNGFLNKGINKFYWDGSLYNSGIYICRLETSDKIEIRKILLIK